MPSDFIEDLQREFDARIEVKTGWGYLEVKRVFRAALIAAMAKYLPDSIADAKSQYKSEKK